MEVLEDTAREVSSPVNLKTLLLDVYRAQEDLINSQQEAIARLLSENTEQENFITELMLGDV